MPSHSIIRNLQDYENEYKNASFEPVQTVLRKQLIISQLQRYNARRILEVGCGMAPLFDSGLEFERMTVVEPGASFSANARAMSADDARITVVESTLEDAVSARLLKGQTFDFIVAAALLHEIPDPSSFLQALKTICTPQTTIHLSVPNARSLHRLLAMEMGLIPDIHVVSDRQIRLQQHHTFDMDELRQLCLHTGFMIIDEGSHFIKPFTHDQMQKLRNVGVLTDRMLHGMVGLEKHLPGLGSEIYVNLRTNLPSHDQPH